jgi:O-antigen/teichoic acid export membrane protein
MTSQDIPLEVRAAAARKKGAKAGAWSAIDVLVRQGILFLVSVVLARLLAPEDFGIIALLAFFTGLSVAFVQGGLSIAIIQRQRTTSEEESAIFWWNLAGSILFGLAIILAGPALAAFFHQPVLRRLVMVAAAQLVFAAGGGVHTAILTKELRFDLLTKCSLFASLASGTVAIAAAVLGAGIWALALQIATLALFNTVALWFALAWRPALHFRFETIRELFGFGAWVSVGNILEVVYTNGVSLLIGKLHGVRQLGFYNQAAATQLLPSSALSTIVSRVALPLLASNQNDPDALRSSLKLAIRSVMLVNVPAMIGLAVLSDLVVTVLFGSRWLPAAPILSILALSGILFPLHVINLQLVLARGQTATFVKIEIAKKSVGIVCIIVGSLFGVIGLAWSQVVYGSLGLLINAGPARRDLGYGPLRQLGDLTGIAVVALLMGGAVYLVRTMISAGPLVTLVACSLCGAAFYATLGWLSGSPVFRDPVMLLAEAFRAPQAESGA